MRHDTNKTQEDVQEEVEARINMDSRQYDDGKSIVRPRDRELFRKLERIELTAQKSEVFFGEVVTAVFRDGSNNTVNHQNVDLEVPHNLRQVPLDAIQAVGQNETASSGGGTSAPTSRRGEKAWTDKMMYFRANFAGTVRFYLVK